jgi:hypothetical protein
MLHKDNKILNYFPLQFCSLRSQSQDWVKRVIKTSSSGYSLIKPSAKLLHPITHPVNEILRDRIGERLRLRISITKYIHR